MAAFDFPAAPTIGQIFAPAGGPTWIWDGVAWTTDQPFPAPVPSFIQQQLRLASGAITLHNDTRCFQVEVQGGGAGGGNCPVATGAGTAQAGTGGSGGAYCSKWIIRPTGTYNPACTVGAAGPSSTAGGTSQFTDGTVTLTAPGGVAGFGIGPGGWVLSNNNPNTNPPSGGDINRPGERGEASILNGGANSCRSGSGGNSLFGVGGAGSAANAAGGQQAGLPAGGYGAGGSGAIATSGGSTNGGGSGSQGCVLITEFR